MGIDAELYRKAIEEYRQWNEAELLSRARESGNRDPDAGWREFNDLWTFARLTGAKPSAMQRKQKLEALELYYERVKKMEAWRRSRG